MRIAAVVANRFNHVYLAAPSITSIKQLKGKKVAVSRFGSGSHFQTNLALKEGGLDPEKDVTVLQIGNSGARITAILSGVVDGTIMAADFVPRAKRERLQHPHRSRRHQDRISVSFRSILLGSYLDRNQKTVKALIKSMSESIRALQSDPTTPKAVIRAVPAHRRRSERSTTLWRAACKCWTAGRFPTPGGIQTVLDELGKEAKGKAWKFDDFVDLRALRELEKEGFFK